MFYVHWVDFNRRLDSWIDRARLDLDTTREKLREVLARWRGLEVLKTSGTRRDARLRSRQCRDLSAESELACQADVVGWSPPWVRIQGFVKPAKTGLAALCLLHTCATRERKDVLQ